MGLKQLIDKAMQGDEAIAAALAEKHPVEISGEAHRAYAHMIRKWSGWNNATLVFGDPSPVSPFASCNRINHVFTANPERLLLNPNRVLITVNPFRMRQEAVLTGALLHEAAHARHSNWIPRSEIEADEFKHKDGKPVTAQEIALAKVLEEARIEGIMASEENRVGAAGLAWTMRASAAHVVPMTELSADRDQALIDLITSWTLRAGRQVALEFHTSHRPPSWVGRFTSLLNEVIVEHMVTVNELDSGQAAAAAATVIEHLSRMARGSQYGMGGPFKPDPGDESDSGPFMVDEAKLILSVLFPETPPNQMPMAGGGCGAGEGEGESSAAADLDAAEAGEAGAGEPSPDEGDGSPGEGEAGAETSTEEGAGTDSTSTLAKALSEIEGTAKTEAVEEGKGEATKTNSEGGLSGGEGESSAIGGGWRMPTKGEREIKTGAEKFLRDLIEPNVASKVRITDQPNSSIDGAALAAWKAGGQVKAPRFFKQVKRTVQPSPPVKIAILVDVSASMDVLQRPSALLSWALAAACLDLRNFAGGGVQIESTLIHWGTTAKVIQRNGEIMPGIREVGCFSGTTAMGPAIDLIEEQIPGFFEVKDKPENKLLVQFTDWRLQYNSIPSTSQAVGKALAAGVNMLSVVPAGYTARHSSLPEILSANPIQRGRNSLLIYQPGNPESVWTGAAKSLATL